jgi:recombination protein RecA
VNKSGAWYTYGPERLGQGREAAKSFLRQNPDLMSEIDHKVRVRSGLLPEDDASDAGDGQDAAGAASEG